MDKYCNFKLLRRTVASVLGTLLVGMATPAAHAQPQAAATGEQIKIGIMAALSGPISVYGIYLADGVKMAIKEVNDLEIGAYGINPSRAQIEAGIQSNYQRFPVLKEKADAGGGTLSGGQQQMFAIGRALMSNPKLLLHDEPSLGLAPQMVRVVYDTIHMLKRQEGMSVLLVEQNADWHSLSPTACI